MRPKDDHHHDQDDEEDDNAPEFNVVDFAPKYDVVDVIDITAEHHVVIDVDDDDILCAVPDMQLSVPGNNLSGRRRWWQCRQRHHSNGKLC